MSLQLTGSVKSIGKLITGEGKNGAWQKRSFVLEYKDGTYAKEVEFSGMKGAADQIGKLGVGEQVTVHFNIESRLYNEKRYTNCSAWKIVTGNTADAPPPKYEDTGLPEANDDNSLPF